MIQRLKLRHLRLVLAIHDASSLAQVAQSLHISPAAVSKALNEVEALLGEPLFERGRGWIAPTPLGETVIASARAIKAELAVLEQRMDALTHGHKGELRIGVKAVSLNPFLARVIASFSSQYPMVRVELVEGESADLLAQVAEGKLSFLFARLNAVITQMGLSCMEVLHDDAVVMASASHPLAAKADLAWPDVLQYPWCLPVPGTLMRDLLEKTLMDEGLSMPEKFVETSDVNLIVPLFRLSPYLTLLPRRVAERFMDASTGRALALAVPAPEDAVGIIWNGQLPMLPAAGFFLEHARAC